MQCAENENADDALLTLRKEYVKLAGYVFLPALSLIKANVGETEEVWEMVKLMSWEERYLCVRMLLLLYVTINGGDQHCLVRSH